MFVGLAEKFLLNLPLLLTYRSRFEAVDHGVMEEVLRESKHRTDKVLSRNCCCSSFALSVVLGGLKCSKSLFSLL